MSESPPRVPLAIAAFALAQAVCWGMTFNLPAITTSITVGPAITAG